MAYGLETISSAIAQTTVQALWDNFKQRLKWPNSLSEDQRYERVTKVLIACQSHLSFTDDWYDVLATDGYNKSEADAGMEDYVYLCSGSPEHSFLRRKTDAEHLEKIYNIHRDQGLGRWYEEMETRGHIREHTEPYINEQLAYLREQ